MSIAHGRYLAERIPGARWVELPGEDFALWAGDMTALADEVEEFLTGHRSGLEATKAVTTVMFTDIVGSTELARTLGDSAWADLLEKHDALVRAELRRFGGQEVDTALVISPSRRTARGLAPRRISVAHHRSKPSSSTRDGATLRSVSAPLPQSSLTPRWNSDHSSSVHPSG